MAKMGIMAGAQRLMSQPRDCGAPCALRSSLRTPPFFTMEYSVEQTRNVRTAGQTNRQQMVQYHLVALLSRMCISARFPRNLSVPYAHATSTHCNYHISSAFSCPLLSTVILTVGYRYLCIKRCWAYLLLTSIKAMRMSHLSTVPSMSSNICKPPLVTMLSPQRKHTRQTEKVTNIL